MASLILLKSAAAFRTAASSSSFFHAPSRLSAFQYTSVNIGKGAQIIAPKAHERKSPISPSDIKTQNPTFFNEIRHGPGPQKGYKPVPGFQPMAQSVTFDDLQRVVEDHKKQTPYGKVPVSWIKASFAKATTSKQLKTAIALFQKDMLDPVNVQTIPREDFSDEVIKACMRTNMQSTARALLKNVGYRIWPTPMTFLKAINLWSYDKAGQIKKPEHIVQWIRLFTFKKYIPFPEFLTSVLENLIKASPSDLKYVRAELAEPFCPEYFTVDHYNMLLQAAMAIKDTHTIEATLKQIDGLPFKLGEKMRVDNDRFLANEIAARVHLKQTEKALEALRSVSRTELVSAALLGALRECTTHAELQPEVAKLAPIVEEKNIADEAVRTGFQQLKAGSFAGVGDQAKTKTPRKQKKEKEASAAGEGVPADSTPSPSSATESATPTEETKK